MDTIFALSSAPGKAGVAVIRVSGPQAFDACYQLAGVVPPARQVSLRELRSNGSLLDQALVLTFEEGQSFTGEAVVEFHVHGSVATVSAICECLGRFEECRPAENGEFTRRALENERLDLTQVEGLADLLEAETESQRRQALKTFSGELGLKCESWRAGLIRAMALLEVTIDFADEDVPEDVTDEVASLLEQVAQGLSQEIAGFGAAERIRTGFEVAIIGAPNVGKSTLLNKLAGREAAITSQVAGTTRDVIEVRMDLFGLPVTFLDTAGLRETDDVIETMGIQRAVTRAKDADLRVYLTENEDAGPDFLDEGDILLRAKSDLSECEDGISGLTGEGIAELVERIGTTLSKRSANAGVATHLRHKRAMEHGREALGHARAKLLQGDYPYEIIVEEIRIAAHALDSLVGRVDVEALLDEIFSSFCLGK